MLEIIDNQPWFRAFSAWGRIGEEAEKAVLSKAGLSGLAVD